MQFTKTVVALTVACASATAAQSCSPNNPTTTPCPPDFTCQALLGSMKGEGTSAQHLVLGAGIPTFSFVPAGSPLVCRFQHAKALAAGQQIPLTLASHPGLA